MSWFNKILFASTNQKLHFLKITFFLCVLGLMFGIIIIPYNDANDEYLHFGLTKFIADKHYLPVFNKDDYTNTECVKTTISMFGQVKNIPVCHTSYSVYPFPSHTISALFIAPIQKDVPYRYVFARLPNVLFFALFLLLVWKIIRLVFHSEDIRLAAFITVAFIPQVTFINSYINSDGFSLMIGALVVYMWFKTNNEGLTRRNIILGAIALGLLASAKYNYFILFPTTIVFLIFSIKRFRWKKIVAFFTVSVLSILTISGWWFTRNYILYKDALGFSTAKKAIYSIAPDYVTIADFGQNFFTTLLVTNWGVLSFKSFFATFGWMSIYLPNIFYIVIYFFVAISLFGWLFHFIDLYAQKQVFNLFKSRLFPLLAASLFTIIGSIGLSVWTSLNNDFQPQGRYLFPALIPVMIGVIKGLQYFSRMIKLNEKIIPITFAGWMMIMWFFSYLMLVFYYEIVRKDANIAQYFFYYEKMVFVLQNDLLRIFLLTGGTIVLVFLILKIWKNLLRDFNAS